MISRAWKSSLFKQNGRWTYEPLNSRPCHLGIDINLEYLAYAVVDNLGCPVALGYAWLTKDDVGYVAAREAFIAITSNPDLHYRFWFKSVTVEEVPFMSQNRKTAFKMNRIAASAIMGVPNMVDLSAFYSVTASQWQNKLVGRSKGLEKDEVRDFCNDRWPNLPQIPNAWEKEVTRGPRRGEVDYKVNDIYDALCIAEHRRLELQ